MALVRKRAQMEMITSAAKIAATHASQDPDTCLEDEPMNPKQRSSGALRALARASLETGSYACNLNGERIDRDPADPEDRIDQSEVRNYSIITIV